MGRSGIYCLSSLNGANGFKLDGENNGDCSGCSVSAAGDINGDGYADVVIGAYWLSRGSYKGRSYVVFGGPGVGSSGSHAAYQASMAPTALNSMGKIMVITVAFPSALPEISMAMAMPIW